MQERVRPHPTGELHGSARSQAVPAVVLLRRGHAAYSERYPPSLEIFKPACRSNELQRCAPAEIVNAYDNTIAYTDYVLSKQIELLRAASDRVDGVLLDGSVSSIVNGS